MDITNNRAMAQWIDEKKGSLHRVYMVEGRLMVYTRKKDGKVSLRRETARGFVTRREHWKKAATEALKSKERELREWGIKLIGKMEVVADKEPAKEPDQDKKALKRTGRGVS